ncbi:uncharacterized protein ATC70_007208 [Mucor velutinosus]|uniref:Mediator of RNA polymerase II transcription subunit 6 n=1 Tax=Mucor velutinosus TaxID=708070 RepID=A0AAN7D454_9FUNG|nr:hypothetical protein ATC70_007208 [Mucor velutinosus]
MQRVTATEDLTSVEWRDTNWLEKVGGFQNQQMVLDYFALSPFWDRHCNNQVLSMQTQYNDLRQPYEATVEALRKMTGIEFAVVHDQPPVWIIQKRYRRGPAPDDVNPIATYYIMGANVYQSPTIYSVIANRLLTSLFHVNSAFKETQSMMDFHPAKGYSWKTSADTNKKPASSSEKSPLTAKSASTNTASTSNTAKSNLRAQETQVFRHWMDRAIETASIKVTQARHIIDTPESDKMNATGAIDSPNSQLRDDMSGKRSRKRMDEGNTFNRKKKAAK